MKIKYKMVTKFTFYRVKVPFGVSENDKLKKSWFGNLNNNSISA